MARTSKTFKQPDQYEMRLVRQLRRMLLGSADIKHLGLIALSAIGLIHSIMHGTQFKLVPALITLSFVAATFTIAFVHGLHLTEQKGVFVWAYIFTVATAFVALSWEPIHHELHSRDLIDKEAQVEAARNEERERKCNEAVAAAVDTATRHRTAARVAVKKCRDEFEANKPFFSTETAEAHCKVQRGALAEASSSLERAKNFVCAPSATGSVKQPE